MYVFRQYGMKQLRNLVVQKMAARWLDSHVHTICTSYSKTNYGTQLSTEQL